MKTYTFTIVIEKEADDPGYFAHCPALPGCFGAGLTVDDTIADMRLAIAAHVRSLSTHGESIPGDIGPPTIAEVTLEVPA